MNATGQGGPETSVLSLLKELVGRQGSLLAGLAIVLAWGWFARWVFIHFAPAHLERRSISLDTSGAVTEFVVRSHEPHTLPPGLVLKLPKEQLENVLVLAGPWLESHYVTDDGKKLAIKLNGFPPDGVMGIRVKSRLALPEGALEIDTAATPFAVRGFGRPPRRGLLHNLEDSFSRWFFGFATALMAFAGFAYLLPSWLSSPYPSRMWKWDLTLLGFLTLASCATYFLAKPPLPRETIVGGLDWSVATTVYSVEGSRDSAATVTS